jgi:hypothetical protein
MSMSKGWITGIVVVAVSCAAIAWGLAQMSERRAAEAAAAERVAVAEAKARLAEMKRRELAAREYSRAQAELEMRRRQEQEQREIDASLAPFRESPRQRGIEYLNERNWQKLDELVDSLAASGKRSSDGDWELQEVTAGISGVFKYTTETDEALQKKPAAYQRERPESAFAPILTAMQLHAAAWRARGSGYSTSVTKEGWQLFKERNDQALKAVLGARSRSERLPAWYVEAIAIGQDANIEDDLLTELFEQGIQRFPGYYPIYSAYARQFAPRWGGTYEAADSFIRAQVADKPKPEADLLYSHLYRKVDYFGGKDRDFFKESLVSWSRLRAGYEMLIQQYPDKLNRADFAAYACRAEDGSGYMKFRKSITPDDFREVAPDGITLEVCDARFLTEA